MDESNWSSDFYLHQLNIPRLTFSHFVIDTIMPQSIPPALAFFFALDGKFPGVGTLELSNPLGWGRKKRTTAPSSVNTATFFINRTAK